MAFPLRRGSKTLKKKKKKENEALGERKNTVIHDSGESKEYCVGYWNSTERNYVFIPHFWDPNFALIFKLLIYACKMTRGLILDSAWLVKG